MGDTAGIAAARLSNGPAHDDSGASADYCRHLIEHEHLWVAVDGDRVLGFAGGVDVGAARLLSDLFVHADEHGRGVGKALLSEVLHGAAHMFTFATHDPAAAPMYERAGMTRRCEVLTLEIPRSLLDPRNSTARLEVRSVDPDRAARLEAESTGVDRTGTYRYWAGRSHSHTLAISDPEGVVAVGAVRVGVHSTRIEHLSFTSGVSRGMSAGEFEFAVLAAVSGHLPGDELQVSVLEERPVAALLQRDGAVVTDTAVYMSTTSDLLSEHVMVVHSGFG